MISKWLQNLRYEATDWFHKSIDEFRKKIVFPRAFLFILGLVFSRGLVEYSVTKVLIAYLTSNWESQNLPKATAIINLQEGISTFMVIVLAHISDAHIGRFLMVAISTALYIIGLVLLWLKDRILTQSREEWLFYVAVLLIALGTAGHETPLKEFLADQLRKRKTKPIIDDEERVEAIVGVWWRTARFSGATLGTFTLFKNTSWAYVFKISAITMGIAYLLFWFGFFFYYGKGAKIGSPLPLVYGVPKAAILKRHIDYPTTSTQFYDNVNNQLPLLPKDRWLRWLDKAAIVESGDCKSKRKVFTVTEVKEVKSLLMLAPMWATFLVYSLVEATGSTFFIEQATNLNDQIGNGFTVPINAFFLIKSLSDFIFSFLSDLLIDNIGNKGTKHRCTLIRIGLGMVSCILCCITATQVEIRRLHLVKIKGVENYPGYTIPMSIFWLTPQFCLLGVMKGLAEEGLQKFFNGQVAHEKPEYRSYGQAFTDFVLGIGKLISIACLFIFKFWFGDAINWSRLDQFYKMLVFLSLGNVFIYICVSGLYCNKVPVEEEEEDLGATLEEEDGGANPKKEDLFTNWEDAVTQAVTQLWGSTY